MIKVLGVYGSRDKDKNTTCFLIDDIIAIDAGNLLNYDAKNIKHLFISHSHLDHILDLPFFIEKHFTAWDTPLNIYALKETVEELKNSIFNDKIWPDFSKIPLLNNKKNTINYIEITPFESLKVENRKITVIPTNHTVKTVGFIIDNSTFIASDTYLCKNITDNLNGIKNLIIETSFPDSMQTLAEISKHLTPKLLDGMLNGFDLNLYVYHLKPQFEEEIKKDLLKHENTKKAVILKKNQSIKI